MAYVITREGGRLAFESTTQSRRPLISEKVDACFVKGADVRVAFQRDGTGRVTTPVLRVGGQARVEQKTR